MRPPFGRACKQRAAHSGADLDLAQHPPCRAQPTLARSPSSPVGSSQPSSLRGFWPVDCWWRNCSRQAGAGDAAAEALRQPLGRVFLRSCAPPALRETLPLPLPTFARLRGCSPGTCSLTLLCRPPEHARAPPDGGCRSQQTRTLRRGTSGSKFCRDPSKAGSGRRALSDLDAHCYTLEISNYGAVSRRPAGRNSAQLSREWRRRQEQTVGERLGCGRPNAAIIQQTL